MKRLGKTHLPAARRRRPVECARRIAARDRSGITLGACALVAIGCVVTAVSARSRAVEQPEESAAAQPGASLDRGLVLFKKSFTQSEGLGPEFNGNSCISCHETPVAGGSGAAPRTFVDWVYGDESDALGAPKQRFAFDPGGAVISAASGAHARRRPPALFGLGYLEAIPIEELRFRSDPFDRDGDGISGRLPRRDDCVGRFGWQSAVCDVAAFVRTALHHELGLVTVPRSRREMSEQDVADLTAFVRSLAPPPPAAVDDGAGVFERAQCSSCHTPGTGIARLAGRLVRVQAYTDALVHEMASGPRHGEEDSRTEFRTPALWGVASTGPPYLHDGSAATVEQAILAHAGEATASRKLYSKLDRLDQRRLLRFVATR